MKIYYDPKVNAEAERNQFKGGNRFRRFWSLLVAEVRCTWYLLGGSIAYGECMFVGYNSSGKRSIVGTATGNMYDDTLTLKHIFWCEKV